MIPRVENLVLDSEGLSAWLLGRDREVNAMLEEFDVQGTEFVVGANTIVEVAHARVNEPKLHWILSRVVVEPVTERSARAAARLLKDAGLHGHKYAIDATVAEMALRQRAPVAMLTSDVDDMAKLCGKRVKLIRV
ncbi:DNA-binding protein [Streptomyces sp. NPDC046887]|uniref:DNA-binding protein n=1 Tax=Streptomyces sp. NPDC046887 TaxID=3155472 RepID=UPI0033C53D5E